MHPADEFAIALADALDLSGGRRLAESRKAHLEHPLIRAATSAVFESIGTPGALAQNFRLLDGDRQLPREHWVRSRMGDGEVLHTEIDSMFVDAAVGNSGQLLAIDSIDEHSQLFLRIREMLEYALRARAWVNVYVTATETSSFGPHTDTQHTIIVQIMGRKQWTVCEEPQRGDDVGWDRASTSILSPGDLLFVPASTGHEVVGIGEMSVHLTIGFDPDCWIPAQVRELGAILGRDLAPPSAPEVRHGLAMIRERRRGSCLPFRHSRSLDDAAHVRWASRLPPFSARRGESGIEVTTMGQTYRFDRRHRALLLELCRGHEVHRNELLALAGADPDSLLAFLVEASSAGLVIARKEGDI